MVPVKALQAHEIIVEDAVRHLGLIGFPKGEPFVLLLWGGDENFHIPSWERLQCWENLEQWHRENDIWQGVNYGLSKFGGGVGVIGSPGGTKNVHIFEVRTLVFEIDPPQPEDFTAEQQQEVWKWAGLPELTLMVFTGRKSVHCYYTLKKSCSPEQGEHARKRLNAAADKALAANGFPHLHADTGIPSPCRVLRLAGLIHPKTGKRAEIVGGCEKHYDLEDILQCCPEVEATTTNRAATAAIAGSGREFFVRPLPDGEVEDPNEQFPSGKDIPPIPIELTLGTKTKQLLTEGLDPEDDRRYLMYYRLVKHLIAGLLQAESLGYTVEGGEEAILELLDKFAVLSEMKGGDLDLVREKHYRPDEPCGETNLCNLYVRKAIRTWAEDNGHWRPTYQQRGSWKKSLDTCHWELTDTNTAETIVAEAFRLQGEATGEILTYHQDRCLKYDPQRGCFITVSRSQLHREIATQMLPLIYQKKQNCKEYKQT